MGRLRLELPGQGAPDQLAVVTSSLLGVVDAFDGHAGPLHSAPRHQLQPPALSIGQWIDKRPLCWSAPHFTALVGQLVQSRGSVCTAKTAA